MKLVIHIGTEKTGTTALQEFLDNNRNELENHGFYFLKSPGSTNNRALPSICMRDERADDFFEQSGIITNEQRQEFRERKISELNSELASLPRNIHTVIASSEHFHSRLVHKDEIERVYALFSKNFETIEIVSYLRRQVDAAVSLYSTALKVGQDVGLKSFVSQECTIDSHYFNYASFLGKWESVFGRSNITVRIFDKALFINGDLIDDLLYVIEPNLTKVNTFRREISGANESIDAVGQILMRFINRLLPRFNLDTGFNQKNIELTREVLAESKGKGLQLPADFEQQIQVQFEQSNFEVKEKYFPERVALFSSISGALEKRVVDEGQERVMDLVIEALRPYRNGEGVISEEHVNLFRDSAMALEDIDINKSYALMKLAQSFRPNGPLINKKVKEYLRALEVSKGM